MTSLSSLLPGTRSARALLLRDAPSIVSRRRPALRASASGPWHLKQLSERIGNTSREKSTSPAGSRDGQASAATARARRVRRGIAASSVGGGAEGGAGGSVVSVHAAAT